MSKLSDKCSNCGSTKSSDFWDYPDGTVLCDKCEKTISAKWEKEHDQPAKSKNEKNIDKCCNCGSTKSKKFWIHNDLPLYVTGSVFCDDCEKLIVPLLKDGVGLNEPKQEKKVTGKELKQPMKNPNLMFFAEFVKPIPYTQDFRKFTLDVCTVICKNCKYVVGIRGKEGEYAEGFAIFCFGIQTYADFSKLLETFIGYLIKEFKKDNLKIDKPMDIPYTYEELMTILSAQGI
ncbi:MAG: hypothetical protein NTY48_04085, partial [Candidatus Diapherotrites archaeon]|nr:hypothetical protein [Candidatus Diapherotrites archaeon]